MEIAQADYSAGNETGRLSLLSFPTQELAEECHSKLASPASPDRNRGIYVKTSGPLVGILESPMDAGSAKKILDAIQSNYSVNWIYENKTKPKRVSFRFFCCENLNISSNLNCIKRMLIWYNLR
jgi:hypothetical protein